MRGGKPFDNGAVGHYVYHVNWSPDGRELIFFRTNRRQNVMEVAAANSEVLASMARSFDGWWNDVQPMLVNEKAVGPRINPFKEIYWKQLGGGPTPELLREMDPGRPLEAKPRG